MEKASIEESERLAYSPAEAAQLLGYSRNGFCALLAAGEIPSFKQGRKRLVRRSDLLDFMERALEKSARSPQVDKKS